jgi:hypothetical protein
MSNTIISKNSNVANLVPLTTELAYGEIAVNTHDGKLFLKVDPGTGAIITAIGDQTADYVWYVSKSGNDDNDGKSLSTAKLTIESAVSEANIIADASSNNRVTIFVKSGDYTENNPITLSPRVTIVGDNLRSVSVRPANVTDDIFWVNNGCYISGITFRGHIEPAAAVAYPSGGAGTITTSPYVQNCSSITTTGAGARIDGSLASGLRSMVFDAYTQINQGGIGIHILNQGYSQLVSIFTICCQDGILTESGGTCSVTNSNSSFGTYALRANGKSGPLYTGTSDGASQQGPLIQTKKILTKDPWMIPLKFHENLIINLNNRNISLNIYNEYYKAFMHIMCIYDYYMFKNNIEFCVELFASKVYYLSILKYKDNATSTIGNFTKMLSYLSLQKKNIKNNYNIKNAPIYQLSNYHISLCNRKFISFN